MNSDNLINCHTHIFNRDIVPVNFLPPALRAVAYLIQNKHFAKKLADSLSLLGMHERALLVKKYHYFTTIGSLKNQLEIFKHLQSFYPIHTKFAVLTMDMEFMCAGQVKQSFEAQLREIATIKKDPAYKDLILPFIFAHPERKDLFSIIRRYFEFEGFAGIKLYPPLGYYPFDERLDRVYEFAERYQIPITSHCSRGGIYYQGDITSDMLKNPYYETKNDYRKNKYTSDIFTHPKNYQYLLQKFPKLKINLAHFGGTDEWEKYLRNTVNEEGEPTWFEIVRDLLKSDLYPNVYADTSYTLYKQSLYPLLKTVLEDPQLRQKVLFGTDFYMVEQELSEREFFLTLKAELSDGEFKQIATTNPNGFLNKKI